MLAHAMYAALCMKGCCLLHVCCTEALRMLCYLLPAHPLAYVVLKLLRHALLETRVGFMYTLRCLASWDTNSALLCYGCYASPCSLHTCEYSVGVHRCWMLAQACYVRVSTLGIRLSMTLRGLLRRLGYACCCTLWCSYMLKCGGTDYCDCDYIMIVYASAQSTYEWFPSR